MISERKLTILYGSSTGTAQGIAEHVWRLSKRFSFGGPVLPMDNYSIEDLINERFVVFVCSTTGVGEEPDNMKGFWKFLLRKSLPLTSLVNLKYGVLALGDSSYTKFNFVGKRLDKRLRQLGAEPLLDIGLCDYQHDLGNDAVSEPWIKNFWIKMQTVFKDIDIDVLNNVGFVKRWTIQTRIPDSIVNSHDKHSDIYHSDQINVQTCEIEFILKKNERTTADDHFQDVRILRFETVNDKLCYAPGDVFNLRPRNSRENVMALFDFLRNCGVNIRYSDEVSVEELFQGPEKAATIGGFSGGANTQNSQDDEYRYAGVEDPKIMITTSRDPSARLKMFVKELRLILPNAQRMNRGNYEMKQLIHACRANDVTDFIILHEHRGVPDNLVICHLPYGPTAFFNLSGVIMRHDIPDIGPLSEQYPHLIFHNFKTDLGLRAMSILKYLFPVPKEDSKRVITFANHDDYICFRHHTYKKTGKNVDLTEVGPRFQIKLYEIKLGTLDALQAADTEWALRPYMNTAAKRRFLSQEDGWRQEDPI